METPLFMCWQSVWVCGKIMYIEIGKECGFMDRFDGYTYVNGGVCASKGFKANGLNCGLNPDKNKNDLCIIVSLSLIHI